MRNVRLKQGVLVMVFVFTSMQFGFAQGTGGYLRIHRKSYTLDFFLNDSLKFTFPVRVGKKSRPTPLGEGFISEKRVKPVFRFVDLGPKQGQIVDSAECANGFRPVNYKVMRALALEYTSMVPNQRIVKRLHLNETGENRYSIHSVTCEETIGHPISKGCIGMRIPDLLELFPYIVQGEHGTRFVVIDD